MRMPGDENESLSAHKAVHMYSMCTIGNEERLLLTLKTQIGDSDLEMRLSEV